MKALLTIAIALSASAVMAQTTVVTPAHTTKKTTTTKSSEYVAPESTDTTVVKKKTQVNPGTVNADGSVTPATQTTTTKKTRKY